VRFIALSLALTFLIGCAAGQITGGRQRPGLLPAEQTLWQLQLGEGEQGFTALLGLSFHDELLDMVLLDSSGFKLFAGSVDRNGTLKIKSVLPLVERRGLPEYLAEACQAIFLIWPEQLPCEGGWFNDLCLEEQQGSLAKSSRRLLLSVWDVVYYRGKDNPVVTRIVMRWFWFKPTLTLELSEP